MSDAAKAEPVAGSFIAAEGLQTYKWWEPPKPVGWWLLDGGIPEARFLRNARPRWFHRTMLRLAFGIRWVDAAL